LYWWLLTSRRWTPPLPINVYVIEHTQGLILLDTGQDRASVLDDQYFPFGAAGILYKRLARFDIGEQDTLTARLAGLGYAPADVSTAIVSHLHQDHIGGLRELTGTRLLVSAAEWAELVRPGPELRGFMRNHIELPGLKWEQVSPSPTRDASVAPFTSSLDLMGDGSLVLLPTPGHTAGSMSLLVRRGTRPPLLLVGDLTYAAEILLGGRVPGVGARDQLTETTRKVLDLTERLPGLVILPAHDPTAARRLLGDGWGSDGNLREHCSYHPARSRGLRVPGRLRADHQNITGPSPGRYHLPADSDTPPPEPGRL
jgi:glyoxylase-like metal-dependent hydrolase (beta-lactamase superfamily II)